MLLLLVLALFIAVGLDPAVQWLNRWVPRWAAVLMVILGSLGIFAGFLALAVPVIVNQATDFARQLPHYLKALNNPHTTLGGLNAKYHLVSRLQKFVSSGNGSGALTSGIIGAGRVILGLLGDTLFVAVVSIYLLSDLRRVKRGLYQLAPRSRRARVVLLADEIFSRVGGYALGNVFITVIAGLATYLWATIFGVPFALLLAFLVGLLDLVPVVGSTIGGVVVSLVALTVSLPVAIATLAFYVAFRLAEDYLLTPRIMERTVKVPGLVTVVVVIVGGSLAGIIGALVAIPVAAAVILLTEEVLVPRLDKT
ncbi:MAG: AI-2E family transporter [Acidimicrobiales bacterium]